MSISKYNNEGYFDPTAYGALANIEDEQRAARYRPIVYVCASSSGDIGDIVRSARRYCRFVVDSGYIPLAPRLLFREFMRGDDDADRDLAGFMSIVLLTKCAELWVFGEVITRDMGIEIAKAVRRGQPVRYFTDDFEEVM